MEILNIIGNISSILGLLVAIFIATKIKSYNSNVKASGKKSKAAGRDIKN